jgi:hypothetical protein
VSGCIRVTLQPDESAALCPVAACSVAPTICAASRTVCNLACLYGFPL